MTIIIIQFSYNNVVMYSECVCCVMYVVHAQNNVVIIVQLSAQYTTRAMGSGSFDSHIHTYSNNRPDVEFQPDELE